MGYSAGRGHVTLALASGLLILTLIPTCRAGAWLEEAAATPDQVLEPRHIQDVLGGW